MSDLINEIRATGKHEPRFPRIAQVLAELPDEASEAVALVLADPDIPAKSISTWVAKKYGVTLDPETVRRWRLFHEG